MKALLPFDGLVVNIFKLRTIKHSQKYTSFCSTILAASKNMDFASHTYTLTMDGNIHHPPIDDDLFHWHENLPVKLPHQRLYFDCWH